ncbi:MAG TPA: sn-glycerol-3-phosphate ABC transporter ATP-binding protein UgpC [Acidimicrobiia bacterium]
MSTIDLMEISKSFGKTTVVDGIDLSIADGEFIVLVGPSGCGKTTTLRMIAGLERPTSGDIKIDGESVVELPPQKRDLAMVFQNYALYSHYTVAKNLAYPLKARGMPKAEISAKVEATADMLGLGQVLRRRPGQLSGGQRQRVALGRAIIREPLAFLMDEPLSNLDAALRVDMRKEIIQLADRLGSTVVYVTHDQVEAMTMADRVVVMFDGQIQQLGTPKEVFERPNNRFVAGFIGTPRMNFFDATVTNDGGLDIEGAVISVGGGVPKVAGDHVVLGVRPEAMVLDPAGPLEFAVTLTENLGSETLTYGQVGSQECLLLVPTRLAPAAGDRIRVSSEIVDMHVFEPGNLGERIVVGA